MKANVFIVWGGNKELADKVSEKIKDIKEFNIQVGGDDPDSLFIGTAVLSQIRMSSVAIILVQNSDKSGDGVSFRPNLMFEWGYIIAGFKSKNVHVFLIDMDEKDLPSDLRGSWAKAVSTQDKTIDEIAQEIADTFDHDYHEQNIDQLTAFENWNKLKINVREHTTNPVYTDREMAAIILYSFQAAYYYHDISDLREWILKIHSNDSIVECVNKIVISSLDYYLSKENNDKEAQVSELFDIIDRLNDEFDLSSEDNEIDKWLHIISYNFMGLCNNRLWDLNPTDCEEYKDDFLTEAADCFNKAIQYLGKNNDLYSDIWRGYIYRNIAIVYAKMGDAELMTKCFESATSARKSSKDYFSTNTADPFIVNYFRLEYIMIQLEKMKYTHSVDKRKMVGIRHQMKQMDFEFANQNKLFTNIKKLLDCVENIT